MNATEPAEPSGPHEPDGEALTGASVTPSAARWVKSFGWPAIAPS